MPDSLPVDVRPWTRITNAGAGVGMAVFSLLTIQHFFAANYPATIFSGSFCDISAFFNCDSSAFSPVSQVLGVPIGYFGLMTGGLVVLGALFPSPALERTNRTIALLNVTGVVGLLAFSLLYHRTLCLLCSGFYAFSFLSFAMFWRSGSGPASVAGRWARPSIAVLAAAAVVVGGGAYGMRLYHDARRDAQFGGAATRIVRQYYSLAPVPAPSVISPHWVLRATDRFEDAPIRIVAYADLLCPDCKLLADQMARLDGEFAGKINLAFQFFPLEARCNQVVAKDLHPGACDLAYIAAQDPASFRAIHDEVFAHIRDARDPAWRQALAKKYGVEAAFTDRQTHDLVARILNTGAEYGKTSDKYDHGIRSTPTMIVNGRMIIGTLPFEQLRALFQTLVDESEGSSGFLERWVPSADRDRQSGPGRR